VTEELATYLDLDSHADVAVLGSNSRIFQSTGRSVKVYGYDPSQGSTERKIVSGCFAYDDPKNGQVILLIVHQGLHVPNVTSSLIPPFQMRENDVIVHDCPKSQMANPTEDDHSIILDSNGERRYKIPLML
jgi:hypothetical protein